MLPLLVVALVFSVVSAAKVMAPKVIAVLVVLITPLRVLMVGLVAPAAAIPPVYVCVPPALPKASVPVLRKDTALVIVPVLPLSAKL